MDTYEKKQMFKERTFKHILDLDPESMEDLFTEGNPYAHLNMRYKLPIDIGIDRREKIDDGEWFNGSHTLIQCHNKTPLEIVWQWIREVWWDQGRNPGRDCSEDEFILPNGLCWGNHPGGELTDTLRNMFMILYKEYCKFNLKLNDWFLKFGGHLELYTDDKKNEVKTPIGFIMWAQWVTERYGHDSEKIKENEFQLQKSSEYFKENILRLPKDTQWLKEHYIMMLVCHRNLFNEFIDKYSLTKKMARNLLNKFIKSLADNCDNKDVDILENLLKYAKYERKQEEYLNYPENPFMKRLWKLRCVRLDPVRWSTIEDFDDIPVKEIQQFYYGHPKMSPWLEFDK